MELSNSLRIWHKDQDKYEGPIKNNKGHTESLNIHLIGVPGKENNGEALFEEIKNWEFFRNDISSQIKKELQICSG